MSLFEDANFRWRETYFVLFQQVNRPSVESMRKSLGTVGPRLQMRDIREDGQGNIESFTLLSPDDFAAMDVSFVVGEEVEEQIRERLAELLLDQLTKEEKRKWDFIKTCDARFDVYHFEQVVLEQEANGEDEDGFLDPGSLLIMLQRLAKLCHGVGLDPQAGTVL